jgi:uncharacterized protein involved in exopolysaccharide biosynthesis
LHPQSLPSGAGQQNSSVRSLLEAAFRYRRLWLTVVVVVIGLVLAFATLMPRQYQSEMNILVQNARGNYQITPQRTSGTIEVNGVTEEQINSEIEVLKSQALADVVVDPQWNGQSIPTMTSQQLKAHDKALADFNKHLSIDMVRKSNIIHVTYTASDPHTANETLHRLLNAFLTKQEQIGHPAGTSQFFAIEAARYKKQLDDAQQQLADFQQKNQIVSLPDTEQTYDRQITDAQNALRSADVQISEVSQRLHSQTGQLKLISPRQVTQERILPNDYSVERMNTLLADLENKRTGLLTKFTPNDRLVQEVDQQIANTKAALANAKQMTSQEHSSDVNPVWQQVTGAIVQNQSERQALKAQRNQIAQQVKQLQDNLSNVESTTVTFTTLRQKVTELENNYQTYSQKRDEAQIADAMDENRLLNVAVVQAPTFTITASSPKPILDIVLGTFTAMFLASFMVFFAETGRSTIATPRELDAASRYPLLATVPFYPDHRGKLGEALTKSARLSLAANSEGSLEVHAKRGPFEELGGKVKAS